MKKYYMISLYLLLGVVLVLTGCTSDNADSTTDATSQDNEQSISDDYPNTSIQLVVPWAAGGETDIIARLIASGLEDELGQPVVVTNVTGGGGTIGGKEVLNADPDGYTLLFDHDESIAMSELTGVRDFNYFDYEPVALVSSTRELIATSSENDWEDMADVIEEAKENPGKIRFGATLGTVSELTPAGIQSAKDVEFNVVGYEGTAERTHALIGGHIDLGIVSITAGKEYLDAGELKILSVLAGERDDSLPDVQTLKEQGIDFEQVTNRGIFAPKGTPEEIVKLLSDAIGKVANSEEFTGKLNDIGSQVLYKGYDEYQTSLEDQYENIKTILEENDMMH